ncbi:hypothetical protein BO83DRAFT_375685 [Aspergillus eucalypticola CBS 122712]|uniref:Uncharacterized protein n=1 Tax=Aspergillus eucalypticola (strain CBS 122712 / IBT 29274) TaxID=1448314 RepID=A0A317W733_ASPEC|nr:uncharacterized protein BO83DRAFT_375685 [Aspergillus eucalypticola CBS 122712]PWY81491.1 hypothetical protein BO83DRAFT_375685 [Aspergillus eucalypticola CBS 122712]
MSPSPTSPSSSPQIRQEPTTHFYPSSSPSPPPPDSMTQHHKGNIENHLDRYERSTSLTGSIRITVESSSPSSHSEVKSKSSWLRRYHD